MNRLIIRKSPKTLLILFIIILNVNSSSQERFSTLNQGEKRNFEQFSQRGISENVGNRRPAISDMMRSMRAAGGSDANLEMLSSSMTRLEGNVANLIQSFLAMQRSVFNLEQLQELLVLLLEDILKQVRFH